jgi:diguanylate cyclase (GGDEF)-like protein
MQLSFAFDLPTLLVVATGIASAIGFFLLFTWLQERGTPAFAWWGAAYLIGGSAMILWSRPLSPPLWSEVPVALLLMACGLVWNGVRVFFRRRVLPLALAAGPLLWISAVQDGAVGRSVTLRLVIGAMIVAAYVFCTTLELWRDRRRSTQSRFRINFVPAIHAGIFLLPLALHFASGTFGLADDWAPLFALDTIIYGLGLAFIVVIMVKDHHVQIHKTAAATDPLTGLYNRRAFFEGAQLLSATTARQDGAISVLMFDLDRFKAINDRFGHATGDQVIRRFADTIANCLRVNDIVGRLGGEEFAAIIAGDAEIAAMIGERVRARFEVAGVQVGPSEVNATCSVGIATTRAASLVRTVKPAEALNELIDRADAALYRAKQGGRNQVQVAPPPNMHPVSGHIAAARSRLPAVSAPQIVPASLPVAEKV